MKIDLNPTTLTELVALFDADSRRELAVAVASLQMSRVRAALYAAIDRIPARWGTWGKLAFRLIARPKLRALVDKQLARLTPVVLGELGQALGD